MMMDYFEIRGRLNNLVEFRRLYSEYIGLTNRERNLAAQLVRQKLEPLARLTVDSLLQVKLGALVT